MREDRGRYSSWGGVRGTGPLAHLRYKGRATMAVAAAARSRTTISASGRRRNPPTRSHGSSSRVHGPTPNTDDSEKWGWQQPSALSFFFFFFLLQTQTFELILSTLELAKSLRDCFFFIYVCRCMSGCKCRAGLYIQMSFSCTTL